MLIDLVRPCFASSAALLGLLLPGCVRIEHDSASCEGETCDSSVDSSTDSGPTPDDTAVVPMPGALFLPNGVANLLLPHDVIVDRARGHAFVTSLIAATVAQVDINTGTLIGVWQLDDLEPDLPEPAVDGLGLVYMSGQRDLPILDVATGLISHHEVGVAKIENVIGQPDGVVVTGTSIATGLPVAVRVGHDGVVLKTATLGAPAVAAVLADGEAAIALLENVSHDISQVEVLDPTTLEVLRTCPANSSGITIAQIADGRFVLPHNDGIGEARCDGGVAASLTIGTENKGAFAVGDGVIVLDRIGTDQGAGQNWGIARTFDADLNPIGPDFSTGKNSGLGDVDTAGTIWTNSEGTSEVWGLNPTTGAVVGRIRVGVHLDNAIVSPDAPGIAWVTGRLSQMVARMDLRTGDIVSSQAVDGWPISPTLIGQSLYFLDQFDQTLYAYDRDTLEQTAHFDLGLGQNVTLNFDSLFADPATGMLYITDAVDNVLIEWDPGQESEVRRWALAGEAVDNPDLAGKLQLLVAPDRIYTWRSVDGVLTAVDPATGDVVSMQAPSEMVLALNNQATPAPLWAPEDGSRLFVGGHAYDPHTLVEIASEEIGVDQILGESAGQIIAWRVEQGDIVVLDSEGQQVGGVALEPSDLMDASPLWAPDWGGRIVYLNNQKGAVLVADLE